MNAACGAAPSMCTESAPPVISITRLCLQIDSAKLSQTLRNHHDVILMGPPQQPSYLRFGVSMDLAGEGNRHALEDFVVLQLLIEGRRQALSSRVLVVLHVVVRFFHRRTLQTELDLTDEPLFEAGHFIFLQHNGRGGRG